MTRIILTIVIVIAICDCQNGSRNQTEMVLDSLSNSIVAKDTLNKILKTYRIKLLSGDSLTVVGFIPSNILIDSVIYARSTFFAKYLSCHKGGALSNFKDALHKSDSIEFELLTNMSTAYSLYDSDGNYFDFNSKADTYCSVPKGSKVRVNSTVYKLFNKGQVITDLLIIDSMEIEITIKANDSSFTRNSQLPERPQFITFMGIDSIARSDNSIKDTLIDSISVKRLTFEAKYLSCFRVKGNIKVRLYQPLKYSHPNEYEEIIAIRTGHGFLVDTTKYHFSGRNSIDSNNFSDSNDVNVYASIYSLFSRNQHTGNIVIIDSVVDRMNL